MLVDKAAKEIKDLAKAYYKRPKLADTSILLYPKIVSFTNPKNKDLFQQGANEKT